MKPDLVVWINSPSSKRTFFFSAGVGGKEASSASFEGTYGIRFNNS